MAKGMLVDLIPNFDKLEKDVEGKKMKKKVDVETDGAPTGGAGGKGGPFGGGGSMKSMAGGITKLLAVIGPIMFIAKALSGMAQIQAMLKMLTTFVQLLLMPFVNMLFTFLKPVLVHLIKLMPAWLDFWKDPIGNLWELVKGIGEFIWNALTQLPGLINTAISNIFDPGKGISDKIGLTGGVTGGGKGPRFSLIPGTDIPSPMPMPWTAPRAIGEIFGGKKGEGKTKQETHIHTEGMSEDAVQEIIKKSMPGGSLFGW